MNVDFSMQGRCLGRRNYKLALPQLLVEQNRNVGVFPGLSRKQLQSCIQWQPQLVSIDIAVTVQDGFELPACNLAYMSLTLYTSKQRYE